MRNNESQYRWAYRIIGRGTKVAILHCVTGQVEDYGVVEKCLRSGIDGTTFLVTGTRHGNDGWHPEGDVVAAA